MNIALLLGLGISIIGSISILIDKDTNVKEIEKESTNQKIYFTDSIEPYIDYYDYRLLQKMLNTSNYITPNDILYLDTVGLDSYSATVLLSAQRKIRSML
jgi:hypothetical protein